MRLIKRTNNLFPSVPSFFDDYFVKDLMGWSNTNNSYGTSLPAVNIKEDENGFNVEVAAPGLSKEDFKIEVEHDVLTISFEKELKNETEESNYTRREFQYASRPMPIGLTTPYAVMTMSFVSAIFFGSILNSFVKTRRFPADATSSVRLLRVPSRFERLMI